MSGIYKCHDCHMSFGTMQLLNKHKRKFCIGGSIGDPDNLMLRRPLRSIESPPPVSPTESVRRPRHKVIDEKVGELKALKERVNKKHDIRNLEERILLDELQDADRKLGIVSPVYRSKSKLPPSRYKDVRKLQEEYESLQDQENIRQRSPLPPTQRKSRASSAMTDTSMSIHLDDEEYSRYNPNQDARAQQLAETHGRQMEYLSLRNRDLEKQRDDIRRRLEQLGTKGVKVDPDNTQQLLEELRAQERRNQLALEELRRQLMNINQPRVNVIKLDTIIENIEHSRNLLDSFEDKLQEELELQGLKRPTYNIDVGIQLSKMSLDSLPFYNESEGPDEGHTESVAQIAADGRNRSSIQHGSCVLGDKLKKRILDLGSERRQNSEFTSNRYNDRSQKNMEKILNELLNLTKKLKNRTLTTSKLSSKREDQYHNLSATHRSHHLSVIRESDNQSYDSEVEKPVIQQPPPPPPPPPQETSRKSYIYPVYYGNSLVAEISALRQAYMQNGGNDIELLDHMSQLQAEAQAIEEAMRKQGMEKQRAPKEKKDVSDHLKTLEFENERLQRELMLLQNLKLKQKNDREGYTMGSLSSNKNTDELERELRRLQADHLAKMMGLQNELELLKQRMLLEKPQQIRIETSQPPQPQIPPPPNKHGDNTEIQPWSLQRPYVEVEPMAPYDQYDDDNRFDKQRVPTAFHTWVATQSNKALSREQPFGYPTRDSDKIEG